MEGEARFLMTTMLPAQCPDVDCHLSDLLYTGGKRFCDKARISVILGKT